MIKDFIIYGMRFKKNKNQIIRIEKSLVVDTWTIKDDNKNMEKIVFYTKTFSKLCNKKQD